MVNHIFGEDSYVECDRFTVVNVVRHADMAPKFRPDTECYCGRDTVQTARVGFHTDTTDETPGDWPSSLSLTYKVHRCEKHAFSENSMMERAVVDFDVDLRTDGDSKGNVVASVTVNSVTVEVTE
jgi:hypothetical protein